MHALALVACVVLCSIGFRIRGGALSGTGINLGGGQMARLSFAIAAALTAYVAGAAWWLALATVPAWWLDSTITLFDAIGLGTVAGVSKATTDPKGRSERWWFWRDFAFLGLRGLLWVTLPALILWWPHITIDPLMSWGQGAPRWWALLIAGPLMPVAYWLGRQSGCKLWGLGQLDWCQTGEAIYGAVLGVGIIGACS